MDLRHHSDWSGARRQLLDDRMPLAFLIVATTLAATFAVIVAGGAASLEVFSVRVIYDVVAGLALIPWLLVSVFRPGWRPASRLMPAIVICLVVYGISTATSRNPRLSVEMLGYAVLLAGIYVLLVALMRRPRLRQHFERLAILLCVTTCGLYLLEVALLWSQWWSLLGHLAIPPLRPAYAGLSVSVNPVATVVLILGAFALATTPWRGRRGAAAFVVVAALVAAATFVTGSRGAWLGMAAGGLVAAVALISTEPPVRDRIVGIVRTRSGAGLIVAGLLLFVALVAVAARSGRLNLGDDSARAAYWAASLRMILSAPLTGVGPGLWGTLRAAYTLPTELNLYVPHAHDIFIQALAEFGVLSLVAGASVVMGLGRLIARALRSTDSRHRRVAYAALFGIVLLAVQQLVDLLVNVPAVLLAIALPVAWLDAVALGSPEPSEPVSVRSGHARDTRWHPLAPLGAALVISVITIGLARVESVANIALASTDAANSGDWSAAAATAAGAAAQDPGVTAYQFQLGLAAANAGDLPQAERALLASASADDYTYAWLDLAAVRWRLGDVAGTRAALSRAERLGWQQAGVALAAGWLRQQVGDHALAISDYGAALAAQPTLAADPYWSGQGLEPDMPQIRAAAAESAARNGGNLNNAAQTNILILLASGDSSAAQAATADLPASERGLFVSAIAAWNGDQQARLRLADDATHVNGLAQIFSALIAERDHDQAAAARYQLLLQIENPSAADANAQLAQVVFGPDISALPSILDRYGSTYRRELPAANVVGILPHVTFAPAQ
jgi:O-antigen ligase